MVWGLNVKVHFAIKGSKPIPIKQQLVAVFVLLNVCILLLSHAAPRLLVAYAIWFSSVALLLRLQACNSFLCDACLLHASQS